MSFFQTTKTFAVIGGAGNLGSYIIDTLLDDCKVPACNITSIDVIVHKGKQGIRSLVVDISDSVDILQEALESVQIVFHTASIIDIRPLPSPRMYDVNVQGTRNVIQACQKVGVDSLVYTSSMEVMSGILANGTLQLGGSEDDAYPESYLLPYAATKSLAEQLVLNANSSTTLKTVVLRPGYILGPGCIGVKIEILRAFQRSQKRPFYITARVPAAIFCVHVQNCAIAHVLVAEKSTHVCGQAFFIKDFDANPVDVAVSAFEGSPV